MGWYLSCLEEVEKGYCGICRVLTNENHHEGFAVFGIAVFTVLSIAATIFALYWIVSTIYSVHETAKHIKSCKKKCCKK